MPDEQIKNIHVILKGSRIDKFLSIKNKLEIISDVDVMRACLDVAHRQIIDNQISLRPDILAIAENIVKSPYIKKRNLIFSVNDILNDSLYNWIQNHYSEYSLHSFSFRKDLSEDEQEIALVFVEHQNSYPRGMTLDDILHFLPSTDTITAEKVIKKFVEYELLEVTKIRDQTYFYAPLL